MTMFHIGKVIPPLLYPGDVEHSHIVLLFVTGFLFLDVTVLCTVTVLLKNKI